MARTLKLVGVGMGLGVGLFATACSNSANVPQSSENPTPSPSATIARDMSLFDSGTSLNVTVPESGRAYIQLNPPSVVSISDAKASSEWDLAFEGFDVFTNSGASGGGSAGALGPFDAPTYVSDTAPNAPFVSIDRIGGAFVDWYLYELATSHYLWSRFHTFGVKDGNRLWKVQVISYYGERDNAPVGALYKIRYAEITGGVTSAVQEVVHLDGTARGIQGSTTTETECIDLGTGQRVMHTTEAAKASSDWHLCFRRQYISVNGESGGPRGVTAFDLDAAKIPFETANEVKARTADSERAAFDAVTASTFDGKLFRGDRIVSGFGDLWIDRSMSPIAPAYGTWLVVDAKGKQKYHVAFEKFENMTSNSPGTVVMRIKPVKG